MCKKQPQGAQSLLGQEYWSPSRCGWVGTRAPHPAEPRRFGGALCWTTATTPAAGVMLGSPCSPSAVFLLSRPSVEQTGLHLHQALGEAPLGGIRQNPTLGVGYHFHISNSGHTIGPVYVRVCSPHENAVLPSPSYFHPHKTPLISLEDIAPVSLGKKKKAFMPYKNCKSSGLSQGPSKC